MKKKHKQCFKTKELKEIADDIAISEYTPFYKSLCKKNQKWLYNKYGRPTTILR